MEKNILVVVDGVPTFNVAVKKEETIGTLKDLLKQYKGYDIKMLLNSSNELKVFENNKYDDMTLESVWSKMKKSKIILTEIQKKDKTITGIKDIDFIILSKMSDEDLNSFCSLDKYAELCKDENFWKARFIQKYGEKAVIYKPDNKTWREHYSYVHYLVLDTGYTSRIIKKLGFDNIETIRDKKGKEQPGFYKVSYKNKSYENDYNDVMAKAIFIHDNLWGNGTYSFDSTKETERILNAIYEKGLNPKGIIVFRIDNEYDEYDDEEFLKDLEYCVICRYEEEEEEDDEDDDESQEEKEKRIEKRREKYKTKTFRTSDIYFNYKLIDAESG